MRALGMNEVLTPAASWIVRITGNSDFAEFEKRFGKDPNARAKRKTGDSKENRCRSFTMAIAEVEAAVDELNSIATMLEPNGNGTGKVEAATGKSRSIVLMVIAWTALFHAT